MMIKYKNYYQSSQAPVKMLFEIGDETWETLCRKFSKNRKSLDQDVEILEKWLKTQKHLPSFLDSQSLRNFVILNKFSIELAKKKIDNYFTIRTNLKEIYGEINPKLPYHEEFCKAAYLVMLPELTPAFHRVFFYQVKDKSLMDTYEPVSSLKKFALMQDLRLREDAMFADLVISDCKDYPTSAILKITPTLLYNLVLILEKIFSLRVQGLYLLNMPPLGAKILSILKKMVKPKIFDRIHVLTSVEPLRSVVPLELLPPEFGGRGMTLDALQRNVDLWFEKNQQVFDALDGLTVNETLRPANLEDDDILGVYGNFKKLDID